MLPLFLRACLCSWFSGFGSGGFLCRFCLGWLSRFGWALCNWFIHCIVVVIIHNKLPALQEAEHYGVCVHSSCRGRLDGLTGNHQLS